MNISIIAETVQNTIGFKGGTAVILGSGLGRFADHLANKKVVPYNKIPQYPSPSVPGHTGELISGYLSGKPVLAAKGRFHYYEGYDWETLVLPVHLFHALNVKTLIITNASGSMRSSIKPGTLFLITGYLDCTFRDSVEDPHVINVRNSSSQLYETVPVCALENNIPLKKGNYCWALGPSYETPAEIKYFRSLGGDVVGMSTVPEMIEAKKCGMEILGISCVTNFAAGLSDSPLNHEEVIETAERTKHEFIELLKAIIHCY